MHTKYSFKAKIESFRELREKGFTLLELIIVIIVLGVLTSLALPRMFAFVDKVKAEEAIKALSLIDKGLQGCIDYGRGRNVSAQFVTDCYNLIGANWASLGINDPTNEISSNFTYIGSGGGFSPNLNYFYAIRAISKDSALDHVLLVRQEGTGTGAFAYCGSTINVGVASPDISIYGCGKYRSLRITSDT